MNLTRNTRKRSRFHLDSDDSEGDVQLGGFTHRGRALDDEDDFKEHIEASSDDEADPDKGKLNEEMVNQMNFGQGGTSERKKTRKEIFEEIIEKSKAFGEARKEMKEMNTELAQELDNDYEDLAGLLDFSRKADGLSKDPKVAAVEVKGREFDSIHATLKQDLRTKAQPVKQELTEKETAAQKRRKLEAMKEEKEDEAAPKRREKKGIDKREEAFDKIIKEQHKAGKKEKAVSEVAKAAKGHAQFDSELESDD